MSITLYTGDNRAILPTLPAGSVQTVVTSPPYWGLRDYGVEGQIGLEPTPAEYVANLVQVFRDVWRVLRDDGTLWLNIDDSYANDTKWGGRTGGKHAQGLHGTTGIGRNRTNTGLPSKSLCGIPWRLALAMQDDGWTLRCDVIWEKPSCMPESCTDRPTRSHEYLFLFSKQEHYFYDAAAVREPASDWGSRRRETDKYSLPGTGFTPHTGLKNQNFAETGRNRRSIWRIANQGYGGGHYAVFPEELARLCILAGSRPGDVVMDPFGGSGTVGRVALRLNRAAWLIELNPAYVEQQERRIDGVQPFIPGLEAAL